MTLPAADVVLHPDADEALRALETSPEPRSRSVARRLRALRPILLVDCLHGEVVPRSTIPPVLSRRYLIENLYVEDLPDFWRMLYTVAKSSGRRYVIILAIVNHADYSRWFPGLRR